MAVDSQALTFLLARCRTGDRGAWDALVDLYWERLYGYALRATRNEALAGDLVQETFLRIVQRFGRYNDYGKFEAWMFRILLNLIRDQGRMKSLHPVPLTIARNGEHSLGVIDGLPGKSAVPSEPLELKENVDRLFDAMEQLSDMEKHVLFLRHFSDMPFKEIARMLNCPLGTVLARAHRALGKLRVLMEVSHETI